MVSRWPLTPIPPTLRGISVQVCGCWPLAGGHPGRPLGFR